MASWSAIGAEAPALAQAARARFDATGLAFLATLRRDGAPRISGIEPIFTLDELWIGSMPDARKGADLRHDPRLALHAASIDKDVTEGDAKVAGRVELVTDVATKASVLAAHRGGEVPDGPFDLFRVDVTEVVTVQPAGDHLVIETWHEGRGTDRVERR